MNKFSAEIEEIRLSNGKLPRYSSVGCYPILYLTRSNDCLCATCVDNLDPDLDDTEGVTAHANYEGPTYCDDCGAEIEAAYN